MDRVLAAADIGSNTAHLLIAKTDGRVLEEIENVNEWLQLGELVARTGVIPEDAAETLVRVVRDFKKRATSGMADGIYVFATEAMRAAKNHDKVIKRIKDATGVAVEIVSAKREAELSLRGIEIDTNPRTIDMLFEVGGGSGQIAQISGGSLARSESLKIGTGTLITKATLRYPCPDAALKEAESFIASCIEQAPFKPKGQSAVCSGGVIRGLWRALHPDGERLLRSQELEYLIWSCSHLTVEQIVQRFNVKPKRAATLVPGAMTYLALMRWVGVDSVLVSEFGIREGAVLEIAAGRAKGCLL